MTDKLTLFWTDGTRTVIDYRDTGNRLQDASDAMNRAGIGRGALAALDFFAQGDASNDWEWNPEERNWNRKGQTND